MTRTPEQQATDTALTAAVEAAIRTVDDGGAGWVTSEYVLVASQHKFDDDGTAYTAVVTLTRDGEVSPHRALGLIEYAAARIRRDAVEA